jgi:ribonuclease Z
MYVFVSFFDSILRGAELNWKHIISSREYGRDPVTFTTAAFNQLRLHQLDAEMFPIPHYSLDSKKEFSSKTALLFRISYPSYRSCELSDP